MRGGRELFWGLLLLGGLSVAVRHRLEQKADDDLRACKANLKNLATACEMYSTDNAGRYPQSLGKLVPEYLKEAKLKSMPVCPGADSDAPVYGFKSATNPDAFSICCSGFNHRPKMTAANYPQYFNMSSCLER
jgi:hypothetical protein